MHHYTREELDYILRTRSGKLEETPYAVLLLAIAAKDESAILELRRNQLQKTVIFDGGAPVECRSNIATEMLSRYLVATGKLRPEEEARAVSESIGRGIPIGEILIERKMLTSSDLYRALQQNLGRKLLEPFSWTNGTYTISRDAPPLGSVLRVKVPQLLMTGIQKVEPQENADAAVAAMAGPYIALVDQPLFGLDEVRLTPNQQKVVDAVKRGTTISELRSLVEQDDLHRTLYALLLLGVIAGSAQPMAQRIARAVESRRAEPAPQVEPAPPAGPQLTPPASADEVMTTYLSFRRKDSFELLGIAEDAGPVAISKAYLAFAETFVPSRFEEKSADGMREKAQEVFLAAARAYAELADPLRRDALLKKRSKLREAAAEAPKPGTAAMIDPEALWKSGRNLAAAGKLREALSSFELAAECDAQNGTYAAEAAWCRYRLGSSPATNTMKLLKNAIRIDPKSGVAYLYAGQVQAALGYRVEAVAYLDRAAKLLPGDPRPAQAVKILGLDR